MDVRIVILKSSPEESLCFVAGSVTPFDQVEQRELKEHLVALYRDLSLSGYQELNTFIAISENNEIRSTKNPDEILTMKYFWATHRESGNHDFQRFSSPELRHLGLKDKIQKTLALIWRARNPKFED